MQSQESNASDPLLKPTLYAPVGNARPGARCLLKGGACACGYVFFPFQAFGCERCGRSGNDVQPSTLSSHGVLIARVEVHVHQGLRTAPFVIGAIQLDAGPVVRTLLLEDQGTLPAGCEVEAVLTDAQTAQGAQVLDLRFAARS